MATVAYCLAPFLLIWLVEHALKKKCPAWIWYTLTGLEFFVIFLITISDPELFIQWGNKFNNQVLVYVTHPLEMALSAGSANWGKTTLYALITILVFYIIYRKLNKVQTEKNIFPRAHIPLIILLAGFNFIMLRGGVGVASISQSSAIYSDRSADNAASINSLWNALYYLVNNTENIYGKSFIYMDEAGARKEFDRQLQPFKDSFLFSDVEKPNILVVMLESFTASGSKYFSGRNDCMPYLDEIARQNLSFMRCYSSGDRTEKGLVSVLSGYPAQPASSIIVFPDKMNKLPSLGRSLKPAGYRNTFIYGGDADFAAMRSYLVLHGFDAVIDKKDFNRAQLNSKWGAHDEAMYSKALEVTGQGKDPFFTVLLSLSSHEPFDVPLESKDLPKDKWYGFKNSLRYADKCLNDFLEACKKQPWYDNTLIVLVADHGHDIGLENIFYFGSEKYHIPLVITGGALKQAYKGMQVPGVVSQTIIPCLVLQNLGMDTKDFRWQTDVFHPRGFAQYHYNNGFGRVTDSSEAISDNTSGSYHFKGKAADSINLLHEGRIFQQILIDDFLKK